ncbi:MAG TPA: nucleotidyltransferase family protein [Candidatus Sulfotelmatobacter sp.]|jgi:predicted nucleotidyltransferase|nr:nucleotidyltransferase family protein [Candidatus Sulfotelmatobacter sp.]
MIQDISTINNLIEQNRSNLTSKFSVTNIGIFCSVASGNNRETSDIDILIEFSEPIGMFTFIELEDHLSNILGKKVDLATPKALQATVKNSILQHYV